MITPLIFSVFCLPQLHVQSWTWATVMSWNTPGGSCRLVLTGAKTIYMLLISCCFKFTFTFKFCWWDRVKFSFVRCCSRTIFPNILGHRSRVDAESGAEYLLLSVIHGLLNGECSPELRLVGCSVLASPCKDNKMIKPCRSTCEALRKDCAHAFEAIEMAWPYFLDCDRFFASDQEGCFDPLAGLKGNNLSSFCLDRHRDVRQTWTLVLSCSQTGASNVECWGAQHHHPVHLHLQFSHVQHPEENSSQVLPHLSCLQHRTQHGGQRSAGYWVHQQPRTARVM